MKTIVVTGPDACGKDTQVAFLKRVFESRGSRTHVSSVWDSLRLFAAAGDPANVRKVLDVFLMDFEPKARSLFLQSVLRNSLKLAAPVDVLLINGSWLKYAASEAAYGVPFSLWLERAGELFGEADLILSLEAPLEACLKRRTEWSLYEQGKARFDGEVADGLQSFQKRVHQNLKVLLRDLKDVTAIDAAAAPDAVSEQLTSVLKSRGFLS